MCNAKNQNKKICYFNKIVLIIINAFEKMQVRQMIAAVIAERQQVRKVRASQGRMPDNVRWR